MEHRSYRQASRADWGTSAEGTSLTLELINCGNLLRLADAAEKIARQLEVLTCGTTSGAARAIIRMDKRMAKRTPLGPRKRGGA